MLTFSDLYLLTFIRCHRNIKSQYFDVIHIFKSWFLNPQLIWQKFHVRTRITCFLHFLWSVWFCWLLECLSNRTCAETAASLLETKPIWVTSRSTSWAWELTLLAACGSIVDYLIGCTLRWQHCVYSLVSVISFFCESTIGSQYIIIIPMILT